jgi:hypothetical protein
MAAFPLLPVVAATGDFPTIQLVAQLLGARPETMADRIRQSDRHASALPWFNGRVAGYPPHAAPMVLTRYHRVGYAHSTIGRLPNG